jgi:hypothetical protein
MSLIAKGLHYPHFFIINIFALSMTSDNTPARSPDIYVTMWLTRQGYEYMFLSKISPINHGGIELCLKVIPWAHQRVASKKGYPRRKWRKGTYACMQHCGLHCIAFSCNLQLSYDLLQTGNDNGGHIARRRDPSTSDGGFTLVKYH